MLYHNGIAEVYPADTTVGNTERDWYMANITSFHHMLQQFWYFKLEGNVLDGFLLWVINP
jgi:hypothetical protein